MLRWAGAAALVVGIAMLVPMTGDHVFGGGQHEVLAVADLRGRALILFDTERDRKSTRLNSSHT